MTDNTSDVLLLEHLKAIRGGLATMCRDIRALRNQQTETHGAVLAVWPVRRQPRS